MFGVSDGINEVRATARLFVRLVTADMLYNSITVRLANIDSVAFLSPLYDRFVAAIATIVPATTDNIFIVNVQNDTDVQEKVSPLPVSVSLSISVSLSVSVSYTFVIFLIT